MFVRRGKNGKAQLVLLDHGLYDRLQPHERKALCQLYKAIITLEEADMEKYSKDLGVQGEMFRTSVFKVPIRYQTLSYDNVWCLILMFASLPLPHIQAVSDRNAIVGKDVWVKISVARQASAERR